MNKPLPTVAILGASGLIGEAVATSLRRDGFPIVPIARRFTAAQRAVFGDALVVSPFVSLEAADLERLLAEAGAEIVVNCAGVLQEGAHGRPDEVHSAFVARLVAALGSNPAPRLLVQLSIPGRDEDDHTDFARTKRDAERTIRASLVPHVILRPGLVVAPAAYGGSALIRALAALPIDLPAREAGSPFATTDICDIADTIAFVGRSWRDGARDWSATWEVVDRRKTTVGDVVNDFRHHFGGPKLRLPSASWLMGLGARLGDLAARLGWSPPIRSTALTEMRRGVAADPEPWIAATGIEPTPLAATLDALPTTVQDRWFARLYLAKALIVASLVLFWCLSGLIALTVAFGAARAILVDHGFSVTAANATTVVSSLVDIAIGVAIAFRRTCAWGLIAGIVGSLGYMAGALVLTPDLWIEPLGALVKTGPAIVLMLVALAILDDR
ncbi:MAG: SDR family oxidoreductase [Bauldia litoralis]|uniref:SDR family oxidoreductase n=1 Tax=Bauldia litoralis TaxID=665467 RepID=UPI0032986153